MKLFLLVALLIIATASARSGMPAPKMRAAPAKVTPIESKVLALRGGGMISRDSFVKFFTVRGIFLLVICLFIECRDYGFELSRTESDS